MQNVYGWGQAIMARVDARTVCIRAKTMVIPGVWSVRAARIGEQLESV